MNQIIPLLIAGTFILFPPLTMAGEQDEKAHSIFVLIENGGTVKEPEEQEAITNTVKHLFHQLTKLSRRRATRNAQISIVLSSLPNRIVWSGKPEQLLQDANTVMELVAFKPTYSDLVRAFQQIETSMVLAQADEYSLYWIGPAIHVPFTRFNHHLTRY